MEILSRYGFAVRKYDEIRRSVVGKIFKKFGKYPTIIQFDEGKEFYNVGVKSLLKDHDVDYFSSKSEKKAAIVERFNRTLKTMMWKYFYAENTENSFDVLDKLVENYNDTVHGTIHMKPKDVDKKNENDVWITLYGSDFGELPLPKFRVGDTVRVVEYKNVFTKGYKANFLEEIYEVTKVICGRPNVYELKDPEDDEPIFGKFYEEELSAVSSRRPDEVEKILKKKNGMALVKWEGYDDREAGSRSWIPLSEAVSKKKNKMGFKNLPKEFFGNDYEKAKRNYELATSRERTKFREKYPYANVEDFIFDADIARNGDVVGTSVKYRRDRRLPDITGYIFKKYRRIVLAT